MKIIIYGANEIGCIIAAEFFEDHDIIIIDQEKNRTDAFTTPDFFEFF